MGTQSVQSYADIDMEGTQTFPMEEVLFETESTHPRENIAEYLEQVAENLRHGEVTLVSGDNEITVEPPERAVFEVKVEREVEEKEEISVEFEIEWEVGDGERGSVE